jgi:hypothetical protein
MKCAQKSCRETTEDPARESWIQMPEPGPYGDPDYRRGWWCLRCGRRYQRLLEDSEARAALKYGPKENAPFAFQRKPGWFR